MKNNYKICAMVTSLAMATLSASLTAAPATASAAVTDIQEIEESSETPVVVLTAGDLVFLYVLELEQGGTEPAPTKGLRSLGSRPTKLDYVLN